MEPENTERYAARAASLTIPLLIHRNATEYGDRPALTTGPVVRVPFGFDPSTLGQILAVLEGRPC